MAVQAVRRVMAMETETAERAEQATEHASSLELELTRLGH